MRRFRKTRICGERASNGRMGSGKIVEERMENQRNHLKKVKPKNTPPGIKDKTLKRKKCH
jgi:hypothetical protein